MAAPDGLTAARGWSSASLVYHFLKDAQGLQADHTQFTTPGGLMIIIIVD